MRSVPSFLPHLIGLTHHEIRDTAPVRRGAVAAADDDAGFVVPKTSGAV